MLLNFPLLHSNAVGVVVMPSDVSGIGKRSESYTVVCGLVDTLFESCKGGPN